MRTLRGSRCFKVKGVRVIFFVLTSISLLGVVVEHLPILTNLFKVRTFSAEYIHWETLQRKPLRARWSGLSGRTGTPAPKQERLVFFAGP